MMTDQCGHPYIHIQTDLCCKYWSYVRMPKLKYSMTLLVTFGNHSTHLQDPYPLVQPFSRLNLKPVIFIKSEV